MTITEILTHVRDRLEPWALDKGGFVEIASGPAHLFSLLKSKPGGLALCVMLASQLKRGEYEEASMADDTFLIVAHRSKSLKLVKGDNLTDGSAGGEGLFDLLEELRDEVRAMDFSTPDTEFTADFKALRPYEWPWSEQTLDAWQLEFSLGTLLEPMTSARIHATTPAPTTLNDDDGEDIIFGGEVYDAGGHYNPATGIFTVPATGYYICELQLTMSGAVEGTIHAGFRNAANEELIFGIGQGSAAVSSVMYLEAGTQIHPYVIQTSGVQRELSTHGGFSYMKFHRFL